MLALVSLCVGSFASIASADEKSSAAAEAASTKTIRRVSEYWTLSPEERQQVHNVDLEITVYYYDPVWRLLWGEDHGQPFYLAAVRKALPIRAGQRVRITGPAMISTGLDGEHAKVEVLEESAPLSPLEGNGRSNEWKLLNSQLVRFDAYVDRQAELNENHLTLSLIVDGNKVLSRIWLDEHQPVPQYEATTVSVSGVFIQSMDPSGQLSQKELWVGSPRQISITGSLETDARFEIPPTPIDQLRGVSMDKLVHVTGRVKSQEIGAHLVIEDATGQVRVNAAQTDVVQVGSEVEVIGLPDSRGLRVQLWRGLYRRTVPGGGAAAPNAQVSGRLRLIDRVKALATEEARRGVAVRLTGVITWLDLQQPFFFLQDPSGASGSSFRRNFPFLAWCPARWSKSPGLPGWRVSCRSSVPTTSSGAPSCSGPPRASFRSTRR